VSPDLEHLIELQRLESAIAGAKAALAAHPQRVADSEARLVAAKDEVDDATSRLRQCQEARRALERDAAVHQGRLSRFKEQLFAVKTNREYQAMQHEIATAQRELDALEEKVLERMMEADVLTARLKAAEAALTAERREHEARRQSLETELASTERALVETTAARATLVQEIEPRLVSLFEQVAKARRGLAICGATSDGLCSVCHVRLRPSVFQQVRHNDAIIQCESCHRVLYWVPPLPPPADAGVAPA
jgi:hypothetical protein